MFEVNLAESSRGEGIKGDKGARRGARRGQGEVGRVKNVVGAVM